MTKAGVRSSLGQWIGDCHVSSVLLSSFTFSHQTSGKKREADLCGAVKSVVTSQSELCQQELSALVPCPSSAWLCCRTKQPRSDWEVPTAESGDDVLRRKHASSQRRYFFLEWKGQKGAFCHLQPECCPTSPWTGLSWCCSQVTMGAETTSGGGWK